MKKIVALLAICFCKTVLAQTLAPSIPAKDVYHGITITDEYRNLENLEDPAVTNWMKEQTAYSESIIKNISNRELFLERLRNIDKRTAFFYGKTIRITLNKMYFYIKNKSDESEYKLYYREGLDGEEKFLFDPKRYKPENNKKYVISYFNPSNDGSKVAVAITEGGKEIAEIIVIDVKSKTILPETLTNTWPSDLGGIGWLPDNSGFVYVYIPNIDSKSDDFIKNTKSVVYKVGDKSTHFKDIFSIENNPELKIDKADFPIISQEHLTKNHFFGTIAGATNYSDTYYAVVNNAYNDKINWKLIFKKEDKIDLFQITDEDVLMYAKQKNNTSTIYKTKLSSPDFKNAKPFIKLKENEILNDFQLTTDGLFFSTVKNGIIAKLYFYKDNNYKEVILPIPSGSVALKVINQKMSDIWVSCSGWTNQTTRYKYDVKTNVFTPEDIKENIEYPEVKDIVAEEINIKTHDGLELPLTIIYKKGMIKNGKNKTIMSGYGAYGSSNSPNFNPYSLLWVSDGGIIVKTHERGGGEKGEEWHQGGSKKNKPNTWKDFISSAEYLIKEGYTSKEYLGISSASAGGILIGRAITERPDLFKAAIIKVGALNALRFEITPNGPNNIKEMGTATNKDEFQYLLEMDAFHHIKKGVNYPATLITAGMNDPRVIAWQPSKFAAKLQANNAGNNPILLNVDSNSGHGMDNTIEKIYENITDTFSFFYWQLGHPDFQVNK